MKTTPDPSIMKSELERFARIIGAQQKLIDWYEVEAERSQFDDEDLPPELLKLEQAIEAAKRS